MNGRTIFDMLPFAIVFIVLGMFGYAMIMIAMSERRIIEENSDEERVRESEKTLNALKLLAPIEIGLVLLFGFLALNYYHQTMDINPVGVGLTAGGVLFSYIGVLFDGMNNDKNTRYTASCDGYVEGVTESEDSDGHVRYSPLIKYYVDGQEYTCDSSISAGYNELPEIGTRMTVYYDPQWPKESESDFERRLGKSFPIWFLAFGMPMAVIGFFILVI